MTYLIASLDLTSVSVIEQSLPPKPVLQTQEALHVVFRIVQIEEEIPEGST